MARMKYKRYASGHGDLTFYGDRGYPKTRERNDKKTDKRTNKPTKQKKRKRQPCEARTCSRPADDGHKYCDRCICSVGSCTNKKAPGMDWCTKHLQWR